MLVELTTRLCNIPFIPSHTHITPYLHTLPTHLLYFLKIARNNRRSIVFFLYSNDDRYEDPSAIFFKVQHHSHRYQIDKGEDNRRTEHATSSFIVSFAFARIGVPPARP